MLQTAAPAESGRTWDEAGMRVGAPSNGGGRRRKFIGAGRLYINADNEASIRFVAAVHPSVQDKGLGTLMAMTRVHRPP